MQHQQPYTISFLQWTREYRNGKPHGEPYRERVRRGIMVGYETTRSKLLAFKTRTHWDNESSTQLLLKGPTVQNQEADFWDCMHYAVVSAICGEIIIDDTDASDECWSWFESLARPQDTPDNMDYFDLLIKKFPTIDLRFENNGF